MTPLVLDRWTALSLAALLAGIALVVARPETTAGFGVLGVVAAAGLWAATWTLAAFGAGRPVMLWLSAGSQSESRSIALQLIAGTGVLTAVAGLLSLAGLFRPWPMMVAAVLWAVVGIFSLTPETRWGQAVDVRLIPPAVLAGVSLLVAATVSPFYDQWHQHLGFPWIWLQQGSIEALSRNWYSFMPVNSSLLFAYGLKTLGPWSAQVIHWWCGVVTVIAIAEMARRSGQASAPLWAVAIFATTPTVLHLGTTAGSDLVVTLFAAGVWLALLSTTQAPRPSRYWVFAGVCVSLAVGTKYTAIATVAIPAAVGTVVLHRPWRSRAVFRPFVAGSLAATGAALAAFAPWGMRNLVVAGNPFFPFLNRLFSASLKVPLESADEFESWLSGFDLSIAHVIDGLDLGIFSPPLDGFPAIGLAYLCLFGLVALTWWRLPEHWVPALTLSSLAGILMWMIGLQVDRYLLPALVPATAVLSASLATTLQSTPGRVRTGLVALMVLIFAWNLSASVSRLGLDRLGCTLGVVELETILQRWVSSSPAFVPVENLPPDARVLLIGEARALGFERPVELEHPFGVPYLLELASDSRDEIEMARRLGRQGITHVLTNRWEADRIARMRSRSRYFETDDSTATRRLDRFARECLEPLWSGRGLGLYRISADCTAPTPGAGDLAAW